MSAGTVLRPLAGAAATALGGLLLLVPPAAATTAPAQQADVLRVRSTVDPTALSSIAPGQQVHWTVSADLDGTPEGDLSVRLWAAGPLVEHPRGLVVELESCAVTWQGVEQGLHAASAGDRPRCATGHRRPVPPQRLADVDPAVALVERHLDRTDGEHLLLTVGLPADAPDELQGARSDVGVGITAVGDRLDPPAGVPAPPPSPTPSPTPAVPGAAPTTGATPPPAAGTPPVAAVPVAAVPVARPVPAGPPSAGPAAPARPSLPSRLARTGVEALPALLLAGGALGAGLLLRARPARRRPGGAA